jgi:hypothetical protein
MAVITKEILYMLIKEFDLTRTQFDERVRVQKILYLLQSFGIVNLGYGFSWYKHGPYSQDLVYDAYEVFKDKDNYREKTKTYCFNKSTNEKIKQFRTAFGSILNDPKNLELVASIRFIRNTWYPNIDRSNVFEHLQMLKTQFFDRSKITKSAAQRAFDICQKLSRN